MPPDDLRRRAASGAKWTTGAALLQAALGLLQVSVLARLLDPAAFGLMAAVVVVVAFGGIFTDLGLNNALITRRPTDARVLSSLYWANVGAGLAVAAAVAIAAPAIAAAFGEPDLEGLVRWAALAFAIGPLGQQFGILLQRELRFRTLAITDVTAASAGFAVAVGAALAGAGAEALVWGLLASAAVRMVVLAAIGLREWRPRPAFARSDLRGYTSFGAYQMGERLTNRLAANVDYILIGAFLGPVALGAYYVAYQLCIKPMLVVNPPLIRVAFPVFATRASDPAAMARGFTELTRLIGLVTAPILTIMAVAASDLVPVAFGPGWERSVVLLQLLAGVGLLKAVTNPTGALLLAKDRPDVGFRYTVVGSVVLVVLLRLAVEDGVTAVAAAFLAFSVANIVLWPYLLRRVAHVPARAYAAAIAVPAGYAAVAGAAMVAARAAVDGPHLVRLVVTAAVGLTVYAAVVRLRDGDRVAEVLRLLRSRGGTATAPAGAPAAPAPVLNP